MQDYLYSLYIYLWHQFPIELSVYPCFEKRIVGRSRTDGKPIIRLKTKALQVLIDKQQALLQEALCEGYLA